MRILVISAAFPPLRAGEADHALHLCRKLANAGLDVHVLTGKKNVFSEHLFKVHSVMTDWSWRDLPTLGSFISRCSPDAIFLIYSGWIYEHHPMITFAPTVAKKLIHKTRFVTQFEVDEGARVDSISIPSRMTRKILKYLSGPSQVDWEFGTLLRDSDQVIVLSDNFATKFLQVLPNINKKILLLPPPPLMPVSRPNAEMRESLRTRFGLKPRDFLLAYFGYVHHFKGIDVLLRALDLIRKNRSNVRLIIIGGTEDDYTQRDGSYAREMATLAEGLGLSENVIWTGKYESDTDFPSACLRSADACVLPFDTGVTLNRSSFAAAVAHGLPTITTKGLTLEPQFIDRENVLLCPPKDHMALAAVINELISSPEMQKTLRLGALELANEWFSWTKTVRLTIAALSGTDQTT